MNAREIESLVTRFRPLIEGYFRKRFASRGEAEDCSQEAILSLLSSINRFQGRSSWSTWIYRICQHVFSNQVRRKQSGRELVQKAGIELTRAGKNEEKDDIGHLRSVVKRLPAPSRRLYAMYYIEDRSINEIAGILNCPEGSVKFLLHELRKKLKELILYPCS